MNLKALLSVYAVFMVVAGAAFSRFRLRCWVSTALPPLNALEGSLARSLGALMVGVGTMSWAARTRGIARRGDPMMLGLVVVNALWTVTSFWTGPSIRGHWFFRADGVAFAMLTLLFLAICHREVLATAAMAADPE